MQVPNMRPDVEGFSAGLAKMRLHGWPLNQMTGVPEQNRDRQVQTGGGNTRKAIGRWHPPAKKPRNPEAQRPCRASYCLGRKQSQLSWTNASQLQRPEDCVFIYGTQRNILVAVTTSRGSCSIHSLAGE